MKEFMNKVTQFMNKIANGWESWSKRTKIVVSITAALAIIIGIIAITSKPPVTPSPKFKVPYTIAANLRQGSLYLIEITPPMSPDLDRSYDNSQIREAMFYPEVLKLPHAEMIDTRNEALKRNYKYLAAHEKVEIFNKAMQLAQATKEIFSFSEVGKHLTPLQFDVLLARDTGTIILNYGFGRTFAAEYSFSKDEYTNVDISKLGVVRNTWENNFMVTGRLNERLDKE